MPEHKYLFENNVTVIKRDKLRIEPYDQGKIENTLRSLFKTSKDISESDVNKTIISIANTVTFTIMKKRTEHTFKHIPTWEIQEILEKELMEFKLYKTLKLCILLGHIKDMFNTLK